MKRFLSLASALFLAVTGSGCGRSYSALVTVGKNIDNEMVDWLSKITDPESEKIITEGPLKELKTKAMEVKKEREKVEQDTVGDLLRTIKNAAKRESGLDINQRIALVVSKDSKYTPEKFQKIFSEGMDLLYTKEFIEEEKFFIQRYEKVKKGAKIESDFSTYEVPKKEGS